MAKHYLGAVAALLTPTVISELELATCARFWCIGQRYHERYVGGSAVGRERSRIVAERRDPCQHQRKNKQPLRFSPFDAFADAVCCCRSF